MSTARYELSAAARLDLLDIWNYLAETASFNVANRVLRNIEARMVKLSRNPRRGHHRQDLTDRPVLFDRVHSWLIIYRPSTKPLQVLRVLHGARDVKGILGDRE